MRRIFVLGSLNVDLVMQSERLPEQGETMRGDVFSTHFGGKGANQAVAAARLGGDVSFCGCVGDDVFGTRVKENGIRQNIDMSRVATISGVSSGVALIHVIEGDNRILLFPGANDHVTREHVDAFLSKARKGDLLVLQLEIPIDVVKYAIKRAHDFGMMVLFNPAPADASCTSSLAFVDVLIVNRIEAKMLTSKDDLEEALVSLQSLGVKNVIVTLGEKGYLFANANERIEGQGQKVDVLDTTGAGDGFVGGIAYALSKDMTMKDALRLANMVGAYSVRKLGAQDSYPNLEEIIGFMESKQTNRKHGMD